MIYLIDAPPKFCPSCGESYAWQPGPRSDFLAGCSQKCKCGAQFQYLPESRMAEAAHLGGGDLAHYLESDRF